MSVVVVAWSTAACTPMYRRELGTPHVQPDGSIGPESSAVRKARAFAASHFKCPSSKVSVQQVNAEMFQAGGCGRTATIYCAKGRKGQCEAEDDEPIVVKAEPSVGDFEIEVARSSLKSVSYADCGSGGKGRIQLTLEPSGKTSTVNIVEGAYDDTTTRCLLDRFAKVSVPAFSGAPRVIRWMISLPEQ